MQTSRVVRLGTRPPRRRRLSGQSGCPARAAARPEGRPGAERAWAASAARAAALAPPPHGESSCNETQSQTMFLPMNTTIRSSRRVAVTLRGMALVGAVAALLTTGCGSSGTTDVASSTAVIDAIGAENEYANVLGQIGGRYVHVSAILDNPKTDPHTFEASPQVAQDG